MKNMQLTRTCESIQTKAKEQGTNGSEIFIQVALRTFATRTVFLFYLIFVFVIFSSFLITSINYELLMRIFKK